MSLTLAPVFGDHMVLQRDLPIRIFGWGKGSGAITFLGETRNITAGEKGWSVLFPALPAGGPYEMTLRLDGETRTLRDILIAGDDRQRSGYPDSGGDGAGSGRRNAD